MTKIAVLGDLHANSGWSMYALDWMRRHEITTAIQVGDFGLYGHIDWGMKFLDRFSGCAKKFGITVYVTVGNHEDHDYVDSIPIHEDGWRHVRKQILVSPRPHRWEWEGVSFLSVGGAPSVDRWYQQNVAHNYYLSEITTPDQAKEAIDGGHADVMIGHDAPYAKGIEAHIQGNPFGFRDEDLVYANEGRKTMDEIFQAVKPRIMFSGHYHCHVNELISTGPSYSANGFSTRDIRYSQLVVLNKDQTNQSIAVLDLETLEVEVPDLFEDFNKYRYGKLGK